jgi:hypothetical protein
MMYRFHAESLEALDTADDIQDGVHRPDFVEMHLLRRDAVHPPLSLTDQLKRAHRALFHPVGYRRLLDESNELADVTAVRLRGDVELDLLARNARPAYVSDRNTHIADAEPAR